MRTLALYIRLSEEDAAVRSGERDESNSITAQRDLMHKYIKEHKEFDDYEVIEYFDDGVSGTKFRTRTQFQKMLSDAENGLFECLMVKDFSRLGRDYIEVGNLMEFTFPQIGLRFISVNDGYDSVNCFGTFGGMDIAFKNLIHHLYSRDLSRKTKSALASKRARGEYVSGFVTYGYKKDPNNKNKLIIDEESAKIVKEIFDMALSGMECLEIAQELNRRKVPTFLAVQKSKSNYVAPQFLSKDLWVQGSVHRILTNEAYTGKMIQGKTEAQGFGDSKVLVKKSREEWQVVENAIPRIISDEIFFEVAKRYKANYKSHKKHTGKNVFCCAYCGKKLRKLKGQYICPTGRVDAESKCTDIKVSQDVLERSTILTVQDICRLVLDKYKSAEELQAEKTADSKVKIKALENRITALTSQSTELYEQFLMEKITKEDYMESRRQTKAEIEKLEEQLADLKESINSKDKTLGSEEIDTLSAITNLESYDKALVSEIIERIIVYDEKHISVEFKGNDIFKDLYSPAEYDIAE